MGILTNLDEIKETITLDIFEGKQDNVQAALPQAIIATASHCKQHKYGFSLLLMSIAL